MGGQGQSPAIWVEGLTCVRGGRTLFEGLSLSLGAGEAAWVVGPNGVGKSSLMRLLAGLLEPVGGTLSVTGRIALANEDLALDRQLSLSAALGFWAKVDGRTAEHIDQALSALGLGHLADVPVRIFSTGQRKRAILARVLASGADIWLLDEPGNGLDTASLGQLGKAMAAHRANGGIIIAASHQPLDLPDAVRLELGT